MTKVTQNPVTIKGVSFNGCLCGCGLAVSSKAYYRPGHDARHAGQVARELAAENTKAGKPIDWAEAKKNSAMAKLPSPELKLKAFNHAERIYAKATTPKRGRTVNGTIKVGRWTYPARKKANGKIERNSKTDGSGDWIEVEDRRHLLTFDPRA